MGMTYFLVGRGKDNCFESVKGFYLLSVDNRTSSSQSLGGVNNNSNLDKSSIFLSLSFMNKGRKSRNNKKLYTSQ
jgi:hypothetical protein